jgi:hypothetical protein
MQLENDVVWRCKGPLESVSRMGCGTSIIGGAGMEIPNSLYRMCHKEAPPLIEALTRIPTKWKATLRAVSVQVLAVAIPYPQLLSNHFLPHAKPRGLEQSRYSTRLGAGCGREANRKAYVYAKADGQRNAYPISKINARPG